jgi:signal transduction histidine kinase
MTQSFQMKTSRRASIVSRSMARPTSNLRNVRLIVAISIGLVLLISLTLGWLGWRLLMQEEALQKQQVESRIEQRADAMLAAFLRRVAETDAWLNRIDTSLSTEAAVGGPAAAGILVRFSKAGVETRPAQSLLYSPAPPSTESFDSSLFALAQRLEFQASDLNAARAALATLTESKDLAVRAEALLRLARVLAKRGETVEALATYSKLANENRMSLTDAPYALLSRLARCELLEASQQHAAARQEAGALIEALESGTWTISKETYAWYSAAARKVAGEPAQSHPPIEKLAVASAVEAAWDEWQIFQRSGSRSLTKHVPSSAETPVLTFLNANPERMAALIFAGDAVRVLVLEPDSQDIGDLQVSLVEERGQSIFGTHNSGGPLQTSRTLSAAGVPWQLHVTTAEAGASGTFLTEHRNYLVLALVAIIAIVATACYTMARGVLREAAAGRLQSDFVSAVSHEFRSPLTTLRQLTELLAEGRIQDESRRRKYFNVLQQETSRLHQLVEDLLDFGRMDAGRRQYQLEKVDLSELVRSGVNEYQSQAGASRHRIEMTAGHSEILVAADREAIRRLVRNLLENAVKYSPEASSVWVETACDSLVAVLRVRDEGIGIPSEEQSRIFEKFVRGEAAKKACIPGTGIGLAMVKEIVRVHEGQLDLSSEVGRGSTFVVRLPLCGVPRGGAQ